MVSDKFLQKIIENKEVPENVVKSLDSTINQLSKNFPEIKIKRIRLDCYKLYLIEYNDAITKDYVALIIEKKLKTFYNNIYRENN